MNLLDLLIKYNSPKLKAKAIQIVYTACKEKNLDPNNLTDEDLEDILKEHKILN